jgi:hypothetical protein
MLRRLQTWARAFFTPSGRNRRARGFRPALDVLEDRCLLAAPRVEMVLGRGGPYHSFYDVGFVRNPVGVLNVYVNGKQVRDPQQVQRVLIDWGDGTGWQRGEVGYRGDRDRIPFVLKGSHVYKAPASPGPIIPVKHYNITTRVTVAGVTKENNQTRAVVRAMPDPRSQPIAAPKDLGGPRELANVVLVLGTGGTFVVPLGETFGPRRIGAVDGSVNGTPDRDPGHYKVQINWGDSNRWEQGEVAVPPGSGSPKWLELRSSHQYNEFSEYRIAVHVTGPDGETRSWETAKAVVKAPDLTGTVFHYQVMDERYGQSRLMPSDGPLPVNLPFLVRATVSNRGGYASKPAQVAFYLSRDKQIDPAGDRLLNATALPALRPGQAQPVQALLRLPSNLSRDYFGTVYVGMVIDPANAVKESNEDNNRNAGDGLDRRPVPLYDEVWENQPIAQAWAKYSDAVQWLKDNGFTEKPPFLQDVNWSKDCTASRFSRYHGKVMPAGAFRIHAVPVRTTDGRWTVAVQGTEALGEPNPRAVGEWGADLLFYVKPYHDLF